MNIYVQFLCVGVYVFSILLGTRSELLGYMVTLWLDFDRI